MLIFFIFLTPRFPTMCIPSSFLLIVHLGFSLSRKKTAKAVFI